MTVITIAFTVKPFKIFSLVPVTAANVFNPDVHHAQKSFSLRWFATICIDSAHKSQMRFMLGAQVTRERLSGSGKQLRHKAIQNKYWILDDKKVKTQ